MTLDAAADSTRPKTGVLHHGRFLWRFVLFALPFWSAEHKWMNRGRLALIAAKRIAWLVVLYPVGPLAMMFWAIPQTQWLATTYVKLWVGWLIGQFFVVLAISAMALMIKQGGIGGYFLSCACLEVATEAISLFAPTGDAGLIKVGPIKV